jgi:hypothetical protein
MKWNVELRGTITRDIRRHEVDAETEAEARKLSAQFWPGYRVYSIAPADPSPLWDMLRNTPGACIDEAI